MSKGTTSETPQQMTKRLLWRLGLLFLCCILGLIAICVVWRCNLTIRSNRAMTRLHKAGYPVSFAEAKQKYYPEIPSNQNAAVFFEQAFTLLPGTNDPDIPMFPLYQSTNRAAFFARENLDAVNDFVISNQACLDFLRQSPAATNCRYPIKFNRWDEILVPHLARIKKSALLLSLDAFVRTRSNDTAGAVEDLNAMFRLCHSLDGEPLEISQMVRHSIVNMINYTLEEMLNTQPFSDSQLSVLSTNFQRCRNPNVMEMATAMEFCAFLEFFNSPATELIGNATQTGAQTNELLAKAENVAYKSMSFVGFYATDHTLYLETMERESKIVRLPFPQRLDSTKEVSNWLDKRAAHSLFDCGFSKLMCSMTEAAQSDEATMEGRLNIARTVLAIERYRLTNANRLPDTLPALVPSVLESVPLDPFDGKPVRYKKLSKGYMVYSIGPDRKDDGGSPRYGVITDSGLFLQKGSRNQDPRFGRRTSSVGLSGRGITNWDITFVVERGF